MRFALSALALLAPPALAQADDFFPLAVGNRWYDDQTGRTGSANGGSQTSHTGTVGWAVAGAASTSDGPVPLVEVTRSSPNGL
ncbi:MAG TPA: hypothetical protein VF576_09815, partial [Rubricoccaceae bacterium]